MRHLLVILIAFYSAFTFAQETIEHEPVANKAEYYVSSFNPRKDIDDLMDWAADFEAWQNESGLYDSMSTSLLVPYFISDTSQHDLVWLNIWPSSTEQYAGLDNWLNNGGKLLSKLPVTNSHRHSRIPSIPSTSRLRPQGTNSPLPAIPLSQ